VRERSVASGAAVKRRLRVLVVDDHEVVHWGVGMMMKRVPWVERCFWARSGAEALSVARGHAPDVALVDLFVGGESGAELCESLRTICPQLRVLLISGAGRISRAAAAACGASGFVYKDWRAADLVGAVRMVAIGMSVFEHDGDPASATAALTEREREVLRLMCTGATNFEIAGRLELSRHTVKEYTSSLYRKLGVRNRAEAVNAAGQLGSSG
jgi:DNA-binding NarL/FixJ family response regulator